ncbi:MAG: hypothetical protein JWP26_1941 [Devosia sp.]|nr:hypothetical protein [Devosia sp.]
MVNDTLKHTVQIGEDVVIPKPDDGVAVGSNSRSASYVTITLRVLAAVELDDQVCFAAGEVGYIRANRLLADKLMTKQLAGTQTGPEFAFGVSGVGA